MLDDVDHFVHQLLLVVLLQHNEGGIAFDCSDFIDPSTFEDRIPRPGRHA